MVQHDEHIVELAPIVLFVYSRLEHTKKTVMALLADPLARESDLVIYSDGPRGEADDVEVANVRSYVRSITGFKSVRVNERERNIGLAANIIDGVSAVLRAAEKIIVLEDDILVSPGFLEFMNASLNHYESDKKVWHVSGWNYPIDATGLPNVYLWREMNCWGWATWKDRWEFYENNALDLIVSFDRAKIKRFNLDGYHSFWDQVVQNYLGEINTWAVFWYATIFNRDGLCLNPTISLVENIGHDGSGENCVKGASFNGGVGGGFEPSWPSVVEENSQAVGRVKRFYSEMNVRRGLIGLLKSGIRRAQRSLRMLVWNKKLLVKGSMLSVKPRSRDFGFARGTPVDRFYINHFLESHADFITGNVLEVASKQYATQFGSANNITELHYRSEEAQGVLQADLTKLDSLPQNQYNCFICTQTLNFIYDVKSSVAGIHHLLNEGGVALITLAGLTQVSRYDMDRWGDYWRFTTLSACRLFEDVFGVGNVKVDFYGNALSATYLLHGYPIDEIDPIDLEYKDADYQVIVTIVATK